MKLLLIGLDCLGALRNTDYFRFAGDDAEAGAGVVLRRPVLTTRLDAFRVVRELARRAARDASR